MQYRVSWHAQQRMRQRRVAKADIEAVLGNPSSTWHDPQQQSWVLTGITSSGRSLLVYVPETEWPPVGKITIKSVAWR